MACRGRRCRHAVALRVGRRCSANRRERVPWGTLVVNGVGCLVFGVVWAVAGDRFTLSNELRTVILVGFLGAFTTFSSFVSEFGQMAMDAEWLGGVAYVLGQNVLGFAAFFLGTLIGRAI